MTRAAPPGGLEELLESDHGLDLVERTVDEAARARCTCIDARGELAVALFRDDRLIARNPTGGFTLRAGSDGVIVSAPVSAPCNGSPAQPDIPIALEFGGNPA